MLRERGSSDIVASFGDDLSWGPIGADVARRARYLEDACPIPGGWGWLPEAHAEFRRDVARPSVERFIWVTRNSPSELSGYLAYLADHSHLNADVIRPDLHLPLHPLYGPRLSTGELSPDEMADVLDNAPRKPVQEDETLFTRWRVLQSEDALLRIVSNGGLVSASGDHFDRLLLAAATEEWKRGVSLVGDALTASFDERLCLSSDFLFSRLSHLVKSGQLEADGDVLGWTGEPRRAPALVRRRLLR